MDSNKRFAKGINDNKLFILVLVIVIALCSGHALQTVFEWANYLPILFSALFIFVLLFEFRTLKLKTVDYAWFIFVLMCVISIIVNQGAGIVLCIQMIATVTFGYYVATHFSFDDFIKWYQRIMTVVVTVSIVCYVLINNTSVLDFLPKIKNINDVEYGIGIIFNYIPVVSERNCGMFWEPGLFATSISISAVFEIVFKKGRINWLRLILYFIAIITANSSAGFVLAFLCIMLIVARNLKIKNFFAWWMPIVIAAFCACIVAVLNFDMIISETALAENEYFEKLLSENVAESTRTNAITHNLEVFASDPIFGVGYVGAAERMEYVADTSTSTYLLSVFGILGAFYTVFWAVGIFKQRKNVFVKILVFIIFMLIVNKEPHQNILSTWIILFYLLNGAVPSEKDSQDFSVSGGAV